MKALDIISIIEKTAPLAAQLPWDASGVQLASFKQNVNRVAVMLDPTLPAITKAAEAGADFILTHHPLSLQPRFLNRADNYLATLSVLLKKDIWLYSAHTSLDANPAGPVRWLADVMGLVSVNPLEVTSPQPGPAVYGLGFSGLLCEPLPYADFCRLLAAGLGKDNWRICGPTPKLVKRVACCPGSGKSMLEAALSARADVFITGDFTYHAALDAGLAGLRVIDVGHFCLEEEMMHRFAAMLTKELFVPVDFFPGRDPISGERSTLP